MKVELILDAKATLGEGPAWDEKTQTLYWVDILGKRIYTAEGMLAELDEFIGCLAPRKNGNLIPLLEYQHVPPRSTVFHCHAIQQQQIHPFGFEFLQTSAP